MGNVAFALLPVCGFGIFVFGWSALAVLLVSVGSCVLTEHFICRISEKPTTIRDYSALVTGLILGCTLPPGFPLWMVAVSGMVAIGIGKMLFGGLGCNVFNPALVGRAFVQAAFPVAITTWTPALAAGRFREIIPSTFTWPFMAPEPALNAALNASVDGFTGATPLALQKFEHLTTDAGNLFFGTTAGSLGETSVLVILIGGAYLSIRGIMNWRIPVGMLLAAFVTAAVCYGLDSTRFPDPLFVLLSGGLMFGAIFMATDMVASPVTPVGIWVYAALMGFLTVIIRLFGGLPEGVMYAILLGNAASPFIEAFTQPRIYGERRKPEPKS